MKEHLRMKTLLLLTTVSITILGFAQQPAAPAPRKVLRGDGLVIQPNTQKGKIAIVNCQKTVDRKVLSNVAKHWADFLRVNVFVTDGKPVDLSTVFEACKSVEANLRLFVIDSETIPTSIVYAPESNWCILNLHPIFADKPGEKLAAMRTSQETTRAFSLLSGAMNSSYPDSLMGPVTKPQLLDLNVEPWRVPIDVIERFKAWYEANGIRPHRIVPYRKACVEGWAPAPTNDFQKAIWDKVHALPTEPIKIKPETTKQAK